MTTGGAVRLRSFFWFFSVLFTAVFFGISSAAVAQGTETPTPTATLPVASKTPTFTPSPSVTPRLDGLPNCPPQDVLLEITPDDLDMVYSSNCSYCWDGLPTPTYDPTLPTWTPIASPTATVGYFPVTPLPTFEFEITAPGSSPTASASSTATATATATDGPTPTSTGTPVPGIIWDCQFAGDACGAVIADDVVPSLGADPAIDYNMSIGQDGINVSDGWGAYYGGSAYGDVRLGFAVDLGAEYVVTRVRLRRAGDGGLGRWVRVRLYAVDYVDAEDYLYARNLTWSDAASSILDDTDIGAVDGVRWVGLTFQHTYTPWVDWVEVYGYPAAPVATPSPTPSPSPVAPGLFTCEYPVYAPDDQFDVNLEFAEDYVQCWDVIPELNIIMTEGLLGWLNTTLGLSLPDIVFPGLRICLRFYTFPSFTLFGVTFGVDLFALTLAVGYLLRRFFKGG